ncbi:hypothetical protein AWC38_SpisGene23399 [Stylophora pistillata]|uniref:Uncharacterized protein n=1 Tax=Stylophora pistillata TaxID=50429 RepID=A0A2B4R4Q9_STYPI|nr:hypothetical protein AWC38_SpisGene23399 [Stylophora pistillata]
MVVPNNVERTGNSPSTRETLENKAQDLQLLQEWQRQYCGGVRQRSVRDISKYDAGTLPLFASAEETNPAEVGCNTTRFEGEQTEEENQPLVGVEVDSSTPVLFKKGEFLAVKPGFEINAPSQVSKANFHIVMTESDFPDNPNETAAIDVMWLFPTETIDEEFGCFVAVGLGMVLKKGILFPLGGYDFNASVACDSDQSDIVYISDSYYSRILNSINKRNPTAFAIAEVTEAELEDDNLGLEQILDSEFDGVDGGHEENVVLHPQEGIAEIRSRRERGVRK